MDPDSGLGRLVAVKALKPEVGCWAAGVVGGRPYKQRTLTRMHAHTLSAPRTPGKGDGVAAL